MKFQHLPALFILLTAMLTSGCTTFHREWREASTRPTPSDDITGRWQGTWSSDVTNHRGKLRCVVTRESPDTYLFHYRATWKKILSGSYKVEETVEREGNQFRMHGGSDLGRLYGGHFTYEGTATPTNFFSTYRSARDHGVFRMTRPQD